MRVSEMFPSDYLRAADLGDGDLTVTMIRIEQERLGDDNRQILYFQGHDKGLVLNKTNANMISSLYGDDTDDWMGEAITLFATMVDYKGKSVPGIRVKPAVKKKTAAAAPSGSQKKISARAPIIDDEVPF